jgi:nucleotide-binding universal stress UspA family protein
MDFRTILVNFDADNFAPGLLHCAVDLVRRFDAKLIGHCARSAPLFAAGAHSALVASRLYDEASAEIEGELAKHRSAFSDVTLGLPATWYGESADPTDSLLGYARRADLIILARPSDDREDDASSRRADVGAVLVGAGIPLLILPPRFAKLDLSTVLIAWKDTREARRAIRDALPFLKLAENVILASADESTPSTGELSLKGVLQWLDDHGVRASKQVLISSLPAATALLRLSEECSAGLLISGGYGHGRLREQVFGGVTQVLLENATVPRLMSN